MEEPHWLERFLEDSDKSAKEISKLVKELKKEYDPKKIERILDLLGEEVE